MSNTIIIGLGNPILSDDGAGVKAARLLQQRLEQDADIEVIELYAGGLRLMDALAGHRRAVIIDAMQTGQAPGTIGNFSLADLPPTRNIACSHDVNLATALELGKTMGQQVPADIVIYGIEAADVTTFSETLTRAVQRAVTDLVETILRDELKSN